MTCLEAQSNIMAFIDKKLPENNISDFVRHINYCPNCAEELEIYYTLIVGIRQVDNNEELSRDFKKDMKAELDKLGNKVKNVKRFKASTLLAISVFFVFVLAFVYEILLSKFYEADQRRLKEEQGNLFFVETFEEYLNVTKVDIVETHKKAYEEYLHRDDKNIYELIHEYNIAHINDDEEQEGLDE